MSLVRGTEKSTSNKCLNKLQHFLKIAALAESLIDELRHQLSQQCSCPCRYAEIFNSILAGCRGSEQQKYNHLQKTHCQHETNNNFDAPDYILGVQGVIDLDDIIAFCHGWCGRLPNQSIEQHNCNKSILANYFGLQKPTATIAFDLFLVLLMPKYQNKPINSKDAYFDLMPFNQKNVNRFEPNSKFQTFVSFVKVILQKFYQVEAEREYLSKYGKQVFSQFHSKFHYIQENKDSVTKLQIKQFMNEYNFYNKLNYDQLCGYIFGEEQSIPWKYLIGNQFSQNQSTENKINSKMPIKKQEKLIQSIDKNHKDSAYHTKFEVQEFLTDIQQLKPKLKNKINKKDEKENKKQQNLNKQNNSISAIINKEIDIKINNIIQKKNETKKLQLPTQFNFTFRNKSVVHPQQKREKEPRGLSKATLKLKQIEQRAMCKYLLDCRNRLQKQARDSCPSLAYEYENLPTFSQLTQKCEYTQIYPFSKLTRHKQTVYGESSWLRLKMIQQAQNRKQLIQRLNNNQQGYYTVKNGNIGRIITQM